MTLDLVPVKDWPMTAEIESRGRPELPKYWERDYINQHIDEVKNISHKVFFQTLWLTGMRTSEAAGKTGFRKADFNQEHYTLKIRWLKKGKYAYRIIPLHPTLRDILAVYTSPYKAEDVIFPFTRQRAYQLTRKYFQGNPHMFRHSFAVNWIRGGGRTSDLSQYLGHSDIRTTMIYEKLVSIDLGKELIKIPFR
jgi:integrase